MDTKPRRILVVAPNPDTVGDPPVRIRILPLVKLLAPLGFELDVQLRPKNYFKRLLLARTSRRYHAVILKSKMLDPSEARTYRHHARKIYFDIDDAIMYHHRKLDFYSEWRLNRRWRATVKIIDRAMVGNQYLADIFAEHHCPTTYCPTVVDPADYPIKQHTQSETVKLVWIGTDSTLPYVANFLPSIAPAIGQIANLKLVIICNKTLENSPLPVEFRPWSLQTEARDLITGDIGIAPTPDDRWTRGKCGFKIVQYMAAGLPTIASPIGANAALVKANASGFLPTTAEEWIAHIVRLARDVSLRQQMGRAARERIENELCIQKIAESWARVLAET